MSLVRLTFRNAQRAPVRGLMTVLAVGVAMVAFLLLRSLGANWTERIRQTPNDRVVSRHAIGWDQSLPVRYVDEVRALPGVQQAMGGAWPSFRVAKDERLRFFSLAVDDPRVFVDMHDELSAPAEHKEAFVANRRGALISEELAEELGVGRGDHLALQSRRYPGEWRVQVSAVVRSTRHGFGRRAVWVHYAYLNERLPTESRDRIGIIAAQIDDPARGASVAKAVDMHFDTQSSPTFTQEDKALNTAIVGRFGAVLDAMSVVSLLVLAVVALIVGNTLAMSTRERVREYGVLRALGFSPGHLMGLVAGEASLFGGASGLIGLALGYFLVEGPMSRVLEESMSIAPLQIRPVEAALSVLASVCLAVLASGLPALRIARLHVREALSGRA